MNSNLHPGPAGTIYKPTFPVLGWVKARLADVMVAAEVLHEARWSAPWDEATAARRPLPKQTHPAG